MTDWLQWHRGYDDPSSSLSKRLAVVRGFAATALATMGPGSRRILSLCAGDGRDILPVLGAFDRRRETLAVLVELEAALAEAARQRAARLHLGCVEVRCADAGDPSNFDDVTPVDLLLICGVFGNIDTDDLATTVGGLPGMLRSGGQVIWTRGAGDPDHRPHVRRLFEHVGFEELDYDGAPASHGVGLAQYPPGLGRPQQPARDRLFRFKR